MNRSEPAFDPARVRADYHALVLTLIERGLTVTAMESATGGQIASLLTDTDGSSAVFPGSLVTYSNREKLAHGVSAETLKRHSVYSEQTALEMARACREELGTELGIGVTGSIGSVDPANPDASVPGEVFLAVCSACAAQSCRLTLPPLPTRLERKLYCAARVCAMLRSLPELL